MLFTCTLKLTFSRNKQLNKETTSEFSANVSERQNYKKSIENDRQYSTVICRLFFSRNKVKQEFSKTFSYSTMDVIFLWYVSIWSYLLYVPILLSLSFLFSIIQIFFPFKILLIYPRSGGTQENPR